MLTKTYNTLGGTVKVSIEDENSFIVFLNNKNFDIQDKEELEEQFRIIFNQLKLRYKLDIGGYYNIIVYKDEIYGMILSIEKEDIEYFDYFDNQIEMRIAISPYNNFIYKLDNNDLNMPTDDCEVYIYLGNIYVKPKKEINKIKFATILEYTTIIYGEEADKIINCAKKVEV